MIDQWATRWGVPPQALRELRVVLLGQRDAVAHSIVETMSEASVSQRVELAFSEMGGTIWRNNVGVLPDTRGVPVRYGLANITPKMNKLTKSGDLIGCLPVVIRPDHIGRTLGLFVSVETKKAAWTWKGNEHELAQLNWAQQVTGLGGIGIFCNDPEQLNFLRTY